ncbi:MAG: dipeptidase [Ignavibacteriae bacterium]|nr:dipeptidase [Ignavibacteriota bacterium]
MKKITKNIFRLSFLLAFIAAFQSLLAQTPDEQLRSKANELAQKFLIVDTHVDVPYRFNEGGWEDISKRTVKGDFDYVRASEGGLNAPFMSIYVPSGREPNTGTAAAPKFVPQGAKALADSLIDMVESFNKKWPDKFNIAESAEDVRTLVRLGAIALPMGMENGSPIEGSLDNLRHFYNRGIRYITLTHGKDNHICDSSYDTTRTWKGLSPFGKQVVAEMNRLGIMVDISHVSDDVFWQVMELSKAPAIASHSSCRAFTPGWQRNMSDDMIKALAKQGGVIMIAWGSSFISDEFRKWGDNFGAFLTANNASFSSPNVSELQKQYEATNPKPRVTVADVAKHIDHVVKLTSVDHVGFGSDFDGVGDTLPEGIKDVSMYPNLIYELLKLGYSEQDIEKICSGNILRVWSKVEQVAKELQGK